MILGKSGSGKSSAGNKILGRTEFKVDCGVDHVTRECQSATAVIDNINALVIDTPGIPDIQPKKTKELKRCFGFTEPGPHVFLFVIRLNDQFSHDINSIKWIKNNFGEVLRFTIILFTHADQLCDRPPVDDFIYQSQHLKTVLSLCGDRYHVFNNLTNNPVEVSELMMKINDLVLINRGGFFSNEIYTKVKTATPNAKLYVKKMLLYLAGMLAGQLIGLKLTAAVISGATLGTSSGVKGATGAGAALVVAVGIAGLGAATAAAGAEVQFVMMRKKVKRKEQIEQVCLSGLVGIYYGFFTGAFMQTALRAFAKVGARVPNIEKGFLISSALTGIINASVTAAFRQQNKIAISLNLIPLVEVAVLTAAITAARGSGAAAAARAGALAAVAEVGGFVVGTAIGRAAMIFKGWFRA